MVSAIEKPEASAPASSPSTPATPKTMPVRTGMTIAQQGRIDHLRCAAAVLISTQRA